MTQPDGGHSPYDPPQQPGPGQPVPPQGAASGQPDPYQQTPYQQQAPSPYQQGPYQQSPYDQGPEGPAYAQGAQPYAYGATPLPKNSLGVWSLVLGILAALGCGLLTGIAAIITGHMSRRAQQEGQADNGGMGLAGIITGWVGIAWTVLYFGFLVVVGVLAVNDPSLPDSFEYEYGLGSGVEQEFSPNATLDPELEELLAEIENS